MTIEREFIIWITIILAAVSSMPSVSQVDIKAVCRINVSISQSKSIPVDPSYPIETCHSGIWIFHTTCWTNPVYHTTYTTAWVLKNVCCAGYELYKNETCKPKCSSKCVNGDCVEPNICACYYGWSGDVCDEPLLCVVRVNSTGAIRMPSAPDEVRHVSENPRIERMRPACHSKCRDQLNATAANETRSSKDGIDYLIPVDSPCNADVHWKKNSRWINWVGATTGILLSTVVISSVYILWKNLRTRNKINNNQPTEFVCGDYMVENTIYS